MTTDNGSGAPPIELLFREACNSLDDAYLRAESELRRVGPAAASFLRARIGKSSEVFERFVAATIADWIDGKGAEFEPAMARLTAMEARLKRTPMRTPRPDVVARVLTQMGADRLVPFLALRLAKERAWPAWKALGVLLYLQRFQQPWILAPLSRYAAITPYRDRHALAVKIIVDVNAAFSSPRPG